MPQSEVAPGMNQRYNKQEKSIIRMGVPFTIIRMAVPFTITKNGNSIFKYKEAHIWQILLSRSP